MRPFWTPLSALIVTDPCSFATPSLLRMLMQGKRDVELLYAGDRMWPALQSGQRVVVEPLQPGATVEDGSVVVACPSGFPDIYRVETCEEGRLLLVGDADPAPPVAVATEGILALARMPRTRISAVGRGARRLAIDLREALRHRPDAEGDPAATVRAKYDSQAPYYSGALVGGIPDGLMRWVLESAPAGGGVCVAGSGTGLECFAIAKSGRRVVGVDFSPAMVEVARAEAKRLGLQVEFLLGDLRSCRLEAGTLGSVYFTYDVYSFIPGRRTRVALLREMGRWLRPDGVMFLSARRFERAYDPLILTIQHAARGAGGSWGESHTRWIAPDGSLHRSFVQVFTKRAILREAEQAGLHVIEWRASHCLLRASPVRE